MHHCNATPDSPRLTSIGFRRQPGHALKIGELHLELTAVDAVRGVRLKLDGAELVLPWERAHTLAPDVTLTASPLWREGRVRAGRAQLRVTAPHDMRVMRAEVADAAEDAEG